MTPDDLTSEEADLVRRFAVKNAHIVRLENALLEIICADDGPMSLAEARCIARRALGGTC